MWIVLAAVAVIALAVVITLMFRHPRGNDLHSVKSYHTALGTLEHLSDQTGRSSVNVVGPGTEVGDAHVRPRSVGRSSSNAGTSRSVPPVPVRGNSEFPDHDSPLVFDDARPRDAYRRETPTDEAPAFRTPRAQRQALDSMNHRPRRVTTVMIVVAALVVFGVLAVVGSRRPSANKNAHAVSTTSSTTRPNRSSSSTTSVANRHGTGTTKPKRRTKPTSTTAPTQIVALSSTSTSATYPVSSSSYEVTVTATGTCWVAATAVATGSTVWAGTLQAGAVQNIHADGVVKVQLGTPSASLMLNQVPVVFPTPVHSPFVATFQPGASPTTTAPTTTAPTTTAPTTTSPTATTG